MLRQTLEEPYVYANRHKLQTALTTAMLSETCCKLRFCVAVPLNDPKHRRLWAFVATDITVVHPVDDIPWSDPDVGEVRALLVHVHVPTRHVEEAMLLYRPDPKLEE